MLRKVLPSSTDFIGGYLHFTPLGLVSVHPETLPKLKLWTPRCPLFGVQSFSFGIFKAVSGWTLVSFNPEGVKHE
jgi:hypothetical protein